ncbi:hypothetical protein BHE90_000156 [Fusarium euwallaceae]|uniref:Heterokaryon incompatibility domain-containing protein n=1 Tax=Fusarium euwallaceae TaxID=1147111 RepID=A0A430MBS8_9HYPO|nr:hypothetical protein BHE90_000156 [Fusarium euwallaceae]
MRLINVRTLELEEPFGDHIPKYAILSHTWGQGEVIFQDWKDINLASQKAGFAKILGACQQAREDSLEYLWVDTNCIDKTSSAELSEAINSMFAWYRDAKKCYAFLADVPALRMSSQDPLEHFCQSRWFTRGWTSQELLAPREVVFFDQDWQKIASITGIDICFITGRSLTRASVAQKMSWLSQRVTTRVEDMAYCMLGIFGINMPLLYGEGTNAFIRLQEEIVKTSTDHTIFCWTWVKSVPKGWVSMLAPTPAAFESSDKYYELPKESGAEEVYPYTFTNAGLSIQLPLVQAWSYSFAVLDVAEFDNWRHSAVPLRFIPELGAFNRISFPPRPVSIEHWLSKAPQNIFLVPSLPSGNSEDGRLFIDQTSYLIGIETYPEYVFRRARSLLMFPPMSDSPEQVSIVLLRLGVLPETGCLLAFAVRTLASGETLWFSGSLPVHRWLGPFMCHRNLVEEVKAEVLSKDRDVLYLPLPHLDMFVCIRSELKVTSRATIR